MGKKYVLFYLALFSTMVASAGSEMRILAPSTYSIHAVNAKNLVCENIISILNPKGQEILKLCKADYRSCKFEGTCIVETQTGLIGLAYHSTDEEREKTYFSQVDTKICPFGYGYVSGKVYKQIKTKHLCLDPFFSVSADLTVYNIGDVLFVPRLQGLELPTGEVHDGFVIVRDSSAFHEGAGDFRITFFTGFFNAENRSNSFARIGLTDVDNHQEFRLATPEEALTVRLKRNFPSLPASLLGKK